MLTMKHHKLPEGVEAFIESLPVSTDPKAGLPTVDTMKTFRESWSAFGRPEMAGAMPDSIEVSEHARNSLHTNPRAIRIYRPKTTTVSTVTKPSAVILCTSGGGFIANNLNTNQSPWARLAEASGIPVIAYEYRVAPEAAFDGAKVPDGIQDAKAMAAWLANNAEALGYDPKKIVLCGDSSGGNFALYQSIHLSKLGKPAASTVVISPVTDVSREFSGCDSIRDELIEYAAAEDIDVLLSASLVEASYGLYAAKQNRKNPIISPLYLGSDKLAHLNNVSFIIHDNDRLKRDSYAMHHRLGHSSELFAIPGVHASLTIRGTFEKLGDAGIDPVLIAAAVSKKFLGLEHDAKLLSSVSMTTSSTNTTSTNTKVMS